MHHASMSFTTPSHSLSTAPRIKAIGIHVPTCTCSGKTALNVHSLVRPLQLNTLFLGPDRPYFQRKLLLVLRSEVGFNYVLSMRNRFFEIRLDY